ncbi:LLM class flavin-dependent oxidoreductase [Actinophytocola glycyrrhizae]|uniref:LLM class flavin-dependent oxidoreductase n=1 Tax=Actinophytocola glycyrrhizae TaxID=2044873 RepID=UPI003670A985
MIGTATVPWLPPTHDFRPGLAALARRAEDNGFTGLLVFYDHMVLDPWAVAGVLLQETTTLVPLVAMQPYTMPPFTAAKTIASLTSLYHRRIDLNIVTGAAPEELHQIGESLDHDGRYERAVEYVTLVRRLLSSGGPVTWDSGHYQYRNLRTNTRLPEHLLPRIFVPGSSAAGRDLVDSVGHVAITHPEPVDRFAESFAATHNGSGVSMGIRVGMVARPTDEEAWAFALDGHQVDRASRLRTLLKRESESDWNRRLALLASEADVHDEVYWTGLYSTGRTGAPLLVGSYDQVARYLGRYLALGVTKLLLTRVDSEHDFHHTNAVLTRLGN